MQNLTIQNFENAEELQSYFESQGYNNCYTLNGFKLLFDLFNDCARNTVIDCSLIDYQFTECNSIEEAMDELGYESREDLENSTMVLEGYGTVIIGE